MIWGIIYVSVTWTMPEEIRRMLILRIFIKIMVNCNSFLTICLFSPAWRSHSPLHFSFLMMLFGEDSFLASFFPSLSLSPSFLWSKFMCNTAGWGSSPLNELITSEVRDAAGLFQESVCFSLHQLSPKVLLTYGWFDLCTPPIFSRGSREHTRADVPFSSRPNGPRALSFLSIIISLLAKLSAGSLIGL